MTAAHWHLRVWREADPARILVYEWLVPNDDEMLDRIETNAEVTLRPDCTIEVDLCTTLHDDWPGQAFGLAGPKLIIPVLR